MDFPYGVDDENSDDSRSAVGDDVIIELEREQGDDEGAEAAGLAAVNDLDFIAQHIGR